VMFTRTDAGISSEHLFYDVDWIVYCEGKNNSDEVSSLDEAFWTKTFSSFGLNCKCKSMGSKPDLLQVAQRVVEGSAQNTIVALDRDYDHLTGKKIHHPRVFYTWGYSWESDACKEFSIRRVLLLFANVVNCDAIVQEFRAYQDSLSRQLKRIFVLDFKYHNHPDKLFDRSKPLSIVELGGSGPPAVRRGMLLKKARQLSRHSPAPLAKSDYHQSCGFRDFFGKVVAKLVFHWFVKRTAPLPGQRKVTYDGTLMSIIDSMCLVHEGEPRNEHYRQKVAALV